MTQNVRTNIGNPQGWGTGDRPYNHTSPRLPEVANAGDLQRLLQERPDEALGLARRLLREEGQGKEISFRYLRQMFADSFASIADSQFALHQENCFEQSQSRMALLAEVLNHYKNHPQYGNEAKALLAEYERISGFNELEATFRNGCGFLGRNDFERMGVFVNMGSSVAGVLGGLIALRFAIRGNLGMSIASGVANALFQSGLQLLHQYGEGTDLSNRQIAGELGESAAAAVACSFVAYGAGRAEGLGWVTRESSLLIRWSWGLTKFCADVGAEYLCNGVSPIKRLLGLEAQGFASTAKGVGYGLLANAVGELMGDATSHLAHPLTHHIEQRTQNLLNRAIATDPSLRAFLKEQRASNNNNEAPEIIQEAQVVEPTPIRSWNDRSASRYSVGSIAAGMTALLGGVLASSDVWANTVSHLNTTSSSSSLWQWILSGVLLMTAAVTATKTKDEIYDELEKLIPRINLPNMNADSSFSEKIFALIQQLEFHPRAFSIFEKLKLKLRMLLKLRPELSLVMSEMEIREKEFLKAMYQTSAFEFFTELGTPENFGKISFPAAVSTKGIPQSFKIDSAEKQNTVFVLSQIDRNSDDRLSSRCLAYIPIANLRSEADHFFEDDLDATIRNIQNPLSDASKNELQAECVAGENSFVLKKADLRARAALARGDTHVLTTLTVRRKIEFGVTIPVSEIPIVRIEDFHPFRNHRQALVPLASMDLQVGQTFVVAQEEGHTIEAKVTHLLSHEGLPAYKLSYRVDGRLFGTRVIQEREGIFNMIDVKIDEHFRKILGLREVLFLHDLQYAHARGLKYQIDGIINLKLLTSEFLSSQGKPYYVPGSAFVQKLMKDRIADHFEMRTEGAAVLQEAFDHAHAKNTFDEETAYRINGVINPELFAGEAVAEDFYAPEFQEILKRFPERAALLQQAAEKAPPLYREAFVHYVYCQILIMGSVSVDISALYERFKNEKDYWIKLHECLGKIADYLTQTRPVEENKNTFFAFKSRAQLLFYLNYYLAAIDQGSGSSFHRSIALLRLANEIGLEEATDEDWMSIKEQKEQALALLFDFVCRQLASSSQFFEKHQSRIERDFLETSFYLENDTLDRFALEKLRRKIIPSSAKSRPRLLLVGIGREWAQVEHAVAQGYDVVVVEAREELSNYYECFRERREFLASQGINVETLCADICDPALISQLGRGSFESIEYQYVSDMLQADTVAIEALLKCGGVFLQYHALEINREQLIKDWDFRKIFAAESVKAPLDTHSTRLAYPNGNHVLMLQKPLADGGHSRPTESGVSLEQLKEWASSSLDELGGIPRSYDIATLIEDGLQHPQSWVRKAYGILKQKLQAAFPSLGKVTAVLLSLGLASFLHLPSAEAGIFSRSHINSSFFSGWQCVFSIVFMMAGSWLRTKAVPIQDLESLEQNFRKAESERDRTEILYAYVGILRRASENEEVLKRGGSFLIGVMEGDISQSGFWSLAQNFILSCMVNFTKGDLLLLRAAKCLRVKLNANLEQKQKEVIPLYLDLLKRCLVDKNQTSVDVTEELVWLYDLLQSRRASLQTRKQVFNFLARSFRNFPESSAVRLKDSLWFRAAETKLEAIGKSLGLEVRSGLKLSDLLQDDEGSVISSRNNWQTLIEYLCELENFELHRPEKLLILFHLLQAGGKKKTVFSSLRAINLIPEESKGKILAELAENIALWPAADPQTKQLGRVKRVRAYLYSLFSNNLVESLGLNNLWERHEEIRDHLIESGTMELFSRAASFMDEMGKEVLKKLLSELALCKIVKGKICYPQRYAYLTELGFSELFVKAWSEEKAPVVIGEVDGKEEVVHVSGLVEDLSRIGVLPIETCQRLTTLWNIDMTDDPPNLHGQPLNLIRLGQFKVANYLVDGVVAARRLLEITLDQSDQTCILAEKIHPEKFGKDSQLRDKIYSYAQELGISRRRVFFAEDSSIKDAPQAMAADIYRDSFFQRRTSTRIAQALAFGLALFGTKQAEAFVSGAVPQTDSIFSSLLLFASGLSFLAVIRILSVTSKYQIIALMLAHWGARGNRSSSFESFEAHILWLAERQKGDEIFFHAVEILRDLDDEVCTLDAAHKRELVRLLLKVLQNSHACFADFIPNLQNEQDKEVYLFLVKLSGEGRLGEEQRVLVLRLLAYYSESAVMQK